MSGLNARAETYWEANIEMDNLSKQHYKAVWTEIQGRFFSRKEAEDLKEAIDRATHHRPDHPRRGRKVLGRRGDRRWTIATSPPPHSGPTAQVNAVAAVAPEIKNRIEGVQNAKARGK